LAEGYSRRRMRYFDSAGCSKFVGFVFVAAARDVLGRVAARSSILGRTVRTSTVYLNALDFHIANILLTVPHRDRPSRLLPIFKILRLRTIRPLSLSYPATAALHRTRTRSNNLTMVARLNS
jgi:hypothetical protein